MLEGGLAVEGVLRVEYWVPFFVVAINELVITTSMMLVWLDNSKICTVKSRFIIKY